MTHSSSSTNEGIRKANHLGGPFSNGLPRGRSWRLAGAGAQVLVVISAWMEFALDITSQSSSGVQHRRTYLEGERWSTEVEQVAMCGNQMAAALGLILTYPNYN